MAAGSPSDARTRILAILSDTITEALELGKLLEDETKALEAQDLDGISETIDNKSARVAKLQALDKERAALCQAWGFEPGPDQMQQVIAWCDDSDLVSNRWDHLMTIATESSARNMTNGAIIRIRQQQFESSLAVIRGVAPGSDTYGRHGGESGDFGRQSLAEA